MASKEYDRYSNPRPKPPVQIKEMTRTPKNRSLFRNVARDSCGETFDAKEEDRLMFLYINTPTETDKLVGVSSYEYADPRIMDAKDNFQSLYFHQLHYLFIKPRHQNGGLGSALLKKIEEAISMTGISRPIHTQSAYKAEQFFQKNGYKQIGDSIDCVCPGSSRFSRLYQMEKEIEIKPRPKKQYKMYKMPE